MSLCPGFNCKLFDSGSCSSAGCESCTRIFDTSLPFFAMCNLCFYDCNCLFRDDCDGEGGEG